jgi:hypothetical protein
VKPDFRSAVFALAALAALVASADAQEATRAGLWQFTAQDQSGASSAGGGTTFTSCIDPARSVPTDPQLACRVGGVNRSGATVTWAMTCTVPQGTFSSQAVARYHGGTMDGTITTEVPVLGGQMVQRISGRYLGACTR